MVIARLQAAMGGVPGMSVFMQPVQDIQIGARISRTQFQYTLLDTDAQELADLGAAAGGSSCGRCRTFKDVATDQQSDGFATQGAGGPGTRRCGWG